MIPANPSLVIADVVGLCPSIPNEVSLRALREALVKEIRKPFLRKMAEFLLKNNYFEFGNKIKSQISGVATDLWNSALCPIIHMYFDERS